MKHNRRCHKGEVTWQMALVKTPLAAPATATSPGLSVTRALPTLVISASGLASLESHCNSPTANQISSPIEGPTIFSRCLITSRMALFPYQTGIPILGFISAIQKRKLKKWRSENQ